MSSPSAPIPVANVVFAAIMSTNVPTRLLRDPAVVLERVARGGGETRWYSLSGLDELEVLAARLSPGSTVSFYFDDRIERCALNDETHDVVLNLIHDHGEAVVGVLSPDEMSIEIEFVSSVGEMSEFLGALEPGPTTLFVGPFPERENDGVLAVTLDLPDHDGVVRPHPH
jgi:hypothetical protein